MSSRTTPSLGSFFSAVSSGEYSHWREQLGVPFGNTFGTAFGGFYMGENIIITAAHTLFDVRYTLSVTGQKIWTLVNAQQAGFYNASKGTVTGLNYSVSPSFFTYVNSKFAADQDPYNNSFLSDVDLAVMTATNSVATRDLVGAGVFFGTSGTNQAAVNSAITLEYRLNGVYGTRSGSLSALSGTSAEATLQAQEGMSGGGWVSGFRVVDPAHKYVIGVQSSNLADGSGSLAALLTPSTFYQIMNTLAAGKTGSQAAQPTNYLHGSDSADTMHGTFRPDVVFGNAGEDTINDGDVGKDYWANDHLFGGPSNDTLSAGRGSDLIHGGDISTAAGGSATIDDDGYDIADYSTQFQGRNGIEIHVGGAALSTFYQSVAYFNSAVFVKDRVSGDVDTLISVEKIKGSLGSDTLVIKTLSSPIVVGAGNSGGLVSVEFNLTKSMSEIDKVDFSRLDTAIVVNLSSVSQSLDLIIWDSTNNPVAIGPNGVYLRGAQPEDYAGDALLALANANYVVGTNVNDGWTDVIIGSDASEVIEATLGADLFVVGNGDRVYFPQFEGMNWWEAVDAIDRGQISPVSAGRYAQVVFNGMALGFGIRLTTESDGQSGSFRLNVAGTGEVSPFNMYYDASTMTAIVTDTRDGSTLVLDNWTYLFARISAQGPQTASLGDGSTRILADAVFPTGVQPHDQQRVSVSSVSGAPFLNAIAAAGLMSIPRAAHAADGEAGDCALGLINIAAKTGFQSAIAERHEALRAALHDDPGRPHHEDTATSPAHRQHEVAEVEHSQPASNEHSMSATSAGLLDGAEALAQMAAAAPSLNVDAAMPSAEMLASTVIIAANPVLEGDLTDEVSRVLADALDRGRGDELDLDSLIAAFLGDTGPAHSFADAIASRAADADPAWGNIVHSAFVDRHSAPAMDMMMIHPDAVQLA